ncbi:MAG: Ni/Fe hydrogenase subunit alpha, partial [Coriobacteriaceae bacterium]|nr:Ni/Fe hydrogenase subunit alpha [Coriobacteriaceae bacterium]
MAITKINVDHIARVEGHGNIHLVIKDGVLETVEMNVVEAARFFEAMVVGRSFRESSYICSRVCGICSPTHVVTDLQAIERIFGVEVSERTKLLRQLLIYGSYLQNHASHLFVFAVPDFIGQPSVFPLADIDPALFSQALGLKRLGNDLCTVVGGRSIHPITAVVGGFTSEPARDEYLRL